MKTFLLNLSITVLAAILCYFCWKYSINKQRPLNTTNQVLTVPPSEDFDNTVGERK